MNTTRTNPAQVVDRYGVHLSHDGLWWLLQDSGGSNARGIDKKCPLVLRPKPRGFCPHDLYLGAGKARPDLIPFVDALARNALTRAFLPFPGEEGRAFFVGNDAYRAVRKLAVLTRSSNAIAMPFLVTPKRLAENARISNISPFVIHSVDVKWMSQNSTTLDVFKTSQRPLVLVGDPDCVIPSWIKRVDFPFNRLWEDLSDIPDLDELGDYILKQWMREEYVPPECGD